MQSINMYDVVELDVADVTSVEIVWARGLKGSLPQPPDLVRAAIDAFREATGIKTNIAAKVTKTIPLGSGMGGGSADAAATLVGLDRLTNSDLTAERLSEIAATIGSDVPFLLQGGVAFASGRGEILRKVEAAERPLWWVLGIPPFPLATKSVYERYDSIWMPESSGCELEEALREGAVAQIASHIGNDLEEPAFQLEHELERMKESLKIAGAMAVTMTGSGSTLAGLCLNETHAQEVAATAMLSFDRVEVVSSSAVGAEIVESQVG